MIGEFSALGSALLWAVTSVLLRGLQSHVNAVSLSGFRCLVGTVVAAAIMLAMGRADGIMEMSLPTTGWLLGSVLLGLGMGDTLFFYGIKLVGIARGLPATSLTPMYTALLAAAFLDEPLTLTLAMGIVLVVSGILLVMMPASPERVVPSATDRKARRLGLLLVTGLAPLCWAGASACLKFGMQEIDPVSATTVRLAVASVVLLGVGSMSRSGLQMREYRGRKLLGILAAGGISAVSAQMFLLAIQRAGVSRTAILTSTAPLFGVPIAMLMGERLTWRIALGTLISVSGVSLVVAR